MVTIQQYVKVCNNLLTPLPSFCPTWYFRRTCLSISSLIVSPFCSQIHACDELMVLVTPLPMRTSLYMWMWLIMSHLWRFIVGPTHKTKWNTEWKQLCHGHKQLITFQSYNWEPSLFHNVTLFYAQHLEYHNLRMM